MLLPPAAAYWQAAMGAGLAGPRQKPAEQVSARRSISDII